MVPVRSARAATRRFVLLAGSALAAPAVARAQAGPAPFGGRPPFALGVASGEPASGGFVAWTRLVADPLSPDPPPNAAHTVAWEVAEDEGFARVVRRGTAVATPEDAHTLHVEVDGLEPGREHWYRFSVGGHRSQAGRARTAPAPGAETDGLSFAFASCQHFEAGRYAAWRDVAERRPDLVLFLGDYIYENPTRGAAVRRHVGGAPHTLDDYRRRLAQYRSDPQLQAAHAAAPWLAIWDDHEVENDYAGERSEGLEPPAEFLRRRAAAYKAWWEHMPLRAAQRPAGPGARIHRSVRFGDLAAFHLLDTRQHRSPQPCAPAGRGGGAHVGPACRARFDPALTMLGREQEAWLERGLAQGGARWTAIVQTAPMAPLDFGAVEPRWRTDQWDGYAAARDRLLSAIQRTGAANPLVLGGDVHAFAAADLRRRYDDPAAPVVAAEFVTTSVSSRGPTQSALLSSLALVRNPHLRFADPLRRGYALATLRRQTATVDFIAVDDVAAADSPVRRLARFEVEAGRPGAQRAAGP